MKYVSVVETYDEIKDIVEEVLGEPRRDYAGSGGWYEYNCPNCADENCGVQDGKYNLALNYEHGAYCHCWRCGWSGKISRLLKTYGTRDMLKRYQDCVRDIIESHYYEIENGTIKIEDTDILSEELKLPKDCRTVYDGTQNGDEALNYLYKRGVTDEIIERFGIMYVSKTEPKGNPYRGMVIIPSYDSFGALNYYTGRDYTGTNRIGKKNPEVSKKEFVFNEGRINWYEPVTLVEGPFDHIVTPNSIPLLGKSLSEDFAVYKRITEMCREKVVIMLDDDAYETAFKMYRLLDTSRLNGMVRIAKCPEGYDPSDVFRDFGRKGILNLISSAEKINEYELLLNE